MCEIHVSVCKREAELKKFNACCPVQLWAKTERSSALGPTCVLLAHDGCDGLARVHVLPACSGV
jgi:hypothetical protein